MYLERVNIPGDAGPGFDDFFAGPQNIVALYDDSKSRFFVLLFGHLAHNAVSTVSPTSSCLN
jgi:hypothetical protein